MRTVEHEGKQYLLLTKSGDSSRVRDPETGDQRYVPTDELTMLDADPLETAASAISDPVRRLVRAAHSDQMLGLVLELRAKPRPARELMDAYSLCESDALGLVTELRAAGLVEETTVAGERGYQLTETGAQAVETLLE